LFSTPADLEIGDTAGLETCGTTQRLKVLGGGFNLGRMKRFLSLIAILFALLLPAHGQNSAAALADKQDAEERYKRMAADVESLQAANAALQHKISALEERMSKFMEDQAKANNNSSVHDDMKVLKEKIQEVDKKREQDKQFITDKLQATTSEIEKMLKKNLSQATVKPTPPREPVVTDKETAAGTTSGLSHTIEDGETLSAIVVAYNREFQAKGMKKISMKMVQAANPSVNWNRLKVGQKIVIPTPAP
jgi:LysM repeat protein